MGKGSSGGSSGGGGTNTVVQSSSPPPQVLAAYQNVINQAQTLQGQPLQQYQGPLVEGFSPDQTQAMQEVQNAQGLAQPYFNSAAQYAGLGAAPVYPNVQQFNNQSLAQYQNPYTQQVTQATQQMFDQQNAAQQNQLAGSAAQAGAFGGERQGVAQAQLAQQQALAENPQLANIVSQGFGQAEGELNTQQQLQANVMGSDAWRTAGAASTLGGLGTSAEGTALGGASSLMQSGALQQELGQENLNIPYEEFQQQQAYPYQQLGWLGGLAEGIGSQMGGTSTTTGPAPSTASTIAGLGLAGLGGFGLGGGFSGLFGGSSSPTIDPSSGTSSAYPFKRGGKILPKRADGGDGSDSVPDPGLDYIPDDSTPARGGEGPPAAPNSLTVGPSPSGSASSGGGLGNILSMVGLGSKAASLGGGSGGGGGIGDWFSGLLGGGGGDAAAGAGLGAGMDTGVLGGAAEVVAANPELLALAAARGGAIHSLAKRADGGSSDGLGDTSVWRIPHNIPKIGTFIPQAGSGGGGGGANGIPRPPAAFDPSKGQPSTGDLINLAKFGQSIGAQSNGGDGDGNDAGTTDDAGADNALPGFTTTTPGGDIGFDDSMNTKRGGVVGYDDGGTVSGLDPGSTGGGQQTVQGQSPQGQAQEQRYMALPVDKLQQLTVAYPANSPMGQTVRQVLQQKLMMPGSSAPASGQAAKPMAPQAPGAPSAGLGGAAAGAQMMTNGSPPNGMARGGMARGGGMWGGMGDGGIGSRMGGGQGLGGGGFSRNIGDNTNISFLSSPSGIPIPQVGQGLFAPSPSSQGRPGFSQGLGTGTAGLGNAYNPLPQIPLSSEPPPNVITNPGTPQAVSQPLPQFLGTSKRGGVALPKRAAGGTGDGLDDQTPEAVPDDSGAHLDGEIDAQKAPASNNRSQTEILGAETDMSKLRGYRNDKNFSPVLVDKAIAALQAKQHKDSDDWSPMPTANDPAAIATPPRAGRSISSPPVSTRGVGPAENRTQAEILGAETDVNKLRGYLNDPNYSPVLVNKAIDALEAKQSSSDSIASRISAINASDQNAKGTGRRPASRSIAPDTTATRTDLDPVTGSGPVEGDPTIGARISGVASRLGSAATRAYQGEARGEADDPEAPGYAPRDVPTPPAATPDNVAPAPEAPDNSTPTTVAPPGAMGKSVVNQTVPVPKAATPATRDDVAPASAPPSTPRPEPPRSAAARSPAAAPAKKPDAAVQPSSDTPPPAAGKKPDVSAEFKFPARAPHVRPLSQSSIVAPADKNRNIYMGLLAAGLGTLASRSPFATQAIGEGGLGGLKTYEGLNEQDQTTKFKDVEQQRQADRDDMLREHYENIDSRPTVGKDGRIYYPSTGQVIDPPWAKEERDRNKQREDEADKRAEAEVQIRRQQARTAESQAAAANERAGRGYEEPLRILTNSDGTPKLGENGLPQAVWRDRVSGKESIGTAPDPNVYGSKTGKGRPPAALQTMDWMVQNHVANTPQEAWSMFQTAKDNPVQRARIVEAEKARIVKSARENGDDVSEADAQSQAVTNVQRMISEMSPKPSGGAAPGSVASPATAPAMATPSASTFQTPAQVGEAFRAGKFGTGDAARVKAEKILWDNWQIPPAPNP